jgi:hypothetical protein
MDVFGFNIKNNLYNFLKNLICHIIKNRPWQLVSMTLLVDYSQSCSRMLLCHL